MSKIKIFYLIPKIVSPTAGTEKQLISLINGLDRNRFDISLGIFNRTNFYLEKIFKYINIINLDIRKVFSLKSIWKLNKTLKEHNVDILHSYFIDGNIISVLSNLINNKVFIITSRRDVGYWYTGFYKFLFKYLDKFTDRILVNSETVRTITAHCEKCSLNKIKVIPNIVDLESIDCKMELSPPSEYLNFISKFKYVVGIVSNLRAVKRIDVFINAAKYVLDQYSKTCFVLIGEGEEHSNLVKQVETLNIKQNCIFLGKQLEIIPYIKSFTIGVNSSDSEGLSNAVIEYMACGIPTIATKVGGNLELIEDNQTGFLFNPGNYVDLANLIIDVLRDEKIRNRIGNKAREKIQNQFDLHTIINEYQKFYEQVLKKEYN